MVAIALRRTVNLPVVGSLWGLTLFALIPFPNLAYLLVGAAANLAANAMALYLICSRSRTDRVHGFARLTIQAIVLAIGTVVLLRSGVSIEGFARYITHHQL